MRIYYSQDIREEELKNRVATEWFGQFDCDSIVGNIDFCVTQKFGHTPPAPIERGTTQDPNFVITLVRNNDTAAGSPAHSSEAFPCLTSSNSPSLLWAEAKAGIRHSLYHSLVQLILTIGKARTFDKHLPPLYLAAFDAAEIAFLPYHTIQPVFYQNDFNWNVAPSNHNSKEFLQLLELVETTLKDNALVFNFAQDGSSLKEFIKKNLLIAQNTIQKIQINKNNFTFVYQRWCEEVKGSIKIDWEKARQIGLVDADFFLADLLSENNQSLLDKLYVLLKSDRYQFERSLDAIGLFTFKEAQFRDKMRAHTKFWNKYERPPRREYWDYIVDRRDLLVPQDVRERKGSFYTPRQWVELSQQYLAETLGENWQDEYYIWDCCAGTGNLLNGLTNKRNVWASTLDRADVDVMHERIKHGANLYDNNVFQFDFLNDDFTKLPQELQDIINDEEKRKKLIIYINPPYKEAASARTIAGTGSNKEKVSNQTKVWENYVTYLGKGTRELFVQFFIRIYKEIHGCVLAEFSKLKILQAPNFKNFRKVFSAKLLNSFIVPSHTFDNVSGHFPVGFFIWDTGENRKSRKYFESFNVYDDKGRYILKKKVYYANDKQKTINKWLKRYEDNFAKSDIGAMCCVGTDFQHNNYVNIDFKNKIKGVGNAVGIAKFTLTKRNVFPSSIYFAVRHCIPATWINDRDQFLYPNNGWKKDRDFQFNCLVFTLFHNQNRISNNLKDFKDLKDPKDLKNPFTNHWIPFTEEEMGITLKLRSHFMSDYIRDFLKGKISADVTFDIKDIFSKRHDTNEANTTIDHTQTVDSTKDNITKPFTPSPQAKVVLDAGREIYRYYHRTWQERGDGSPDASLYDIKEYFKGRDANGKMKNKSDDATFNDLMENLRANLQDLAEAIEPKVYEYGFLK